METLHCCPDDEGVRLFPSTKSTEEPKSFTFRTIYAIYLKLKNEQKADPCLVDVPDITKLGLLEIVRQKKEAPLEESLK